MSTNNAPFPSLRTAYLRSIARAWRDPEYKDRLVRASKDPRAIRGALDVLEPDFGFLFPFNVKFKIDDAPATRPQWRPIGTLGWFGFADRFHLHLPAKPARIEDEAVALARYCHDFPSLLGRPLDGVSEAPADFANFGLITARLVALAWTDPAFRERLYAPEDRRGLVQDAMGWIVPWNFALTFAEHPAGSAIPPSEITVNLPKEPGPEIQAIALASYNDTGAQYPFTCA